MWFLTEDDDEKVSLTNPNNVCGGQKAWFLTEDEGEKMKVCFKSTTSRSTQEQWFLADLTNGKVSSNGVRKTQEALFLTEDDNEKIKCTLNLGGEHYSHGGVRENTEMWLLTEDEKVKNIVRTLGGVQEMWFLTEDEGEKLKRTLYVSDQGRAIWFLTENVLDVIKRRKEKEKNAISRHNKQI